MYSLLAWSFGFGLRTGKKLHRVFGLLCDSTSFWHCLFWKSQISGTFWTSGTFNWMHFFGFFKKVLDFLAYSLVRWNILYFDQLVSLRWCCHVYSCRVCNLLTVEGPCPIFISLPFRPIDLSREKWDSIYFHNRISWSYKSASGEFCSLLAAMVDVRTLYPT